MSQIVALKWKAGEITEEEAAALLTLIGVGEEKLREIVEYRSLAEPDEGEEIRLRAMAAEIIDAINALTEPVPDGDEDDAALTN